MIAIEKEIQGMTPDASNPFFKSSYITLDGILEYIRPILAKNNVWLFQNAFGDGEYICVVTRLNHSTGEFIETDILKMKPQKNDPQQLGSCITYAKRYQLASLLGISSETDDDGNKATMGNGKQNNKNTQNKASNTNNGSIRKFKCQKCGDDIAENVAKFSKSKFGHLLCMDCQKSVSNAKR